MNRGELTRVSVSAPYPTIINPRRNRYQSHVLTHIRVCLTCTAKTIEILIPAHTLIWIFNVKLMSQFEMIQLCPDLEHTSNVVAKSKGAGKINAIVADH